MTCNCVVSIAVVFVYLYILFQGLTYLVLYIIRYSKGKRAEEAVRGGDDQLEDLPSNDPQSEPPQLENARSSSTQSNSDDTQLVNTQSPGTQSEGTKNKTAESLPQKDPPPTIYPFLETKTPSPTTALEVQALPETEQLLLGHKAAWLSSPYPSQLASIVARIIEDRKDSPISNAVLLGVAGKPGFSGKGQQRDLQQFLAFSQICAQLATARPSLLDNIIVQDPNMLPEWKAMFESHGCKVVDSPAAFRSIGETTFLFSAWVKPEEALLKGLQDRPVSELALFVGNDFRCLINVPHKDSLHKQIALALYSPILCNTAEFPCSPTPEQHVNASNGLSGLALWWRPFRTASQRLLDERTEDAALRSFAVACAHGFPGPFIAFHRAYQAGLSCLPREKQDRVVYSYIADLHERGRGFHPPPATAPAHCGDFAEYIVRYLDTGGMAGEQERYEASIDLYLRKAEGRLPFEQFLYTRRLRGNWSQTDVSFWNPRMFE
jgi:hypothetical protein